MSVLEQMIDYGHERVAFHQDPESGLRAIIALHSSVLGPALGGTRRWCYATESDALHDVLRLSQGMTYKCACAGLATGGAKSVVWLQKPGQKSTEAEARAMGRFVDTFDGAYIAAEDVGVDIQFIDWMAKETTHVMGGETLSRGGDPSPFTSSGVIHGMRAAVKCALGCDDLEGLTIAVQGLGSVGYYLTRDLIKAGATVIGADIDDSCVERCRDEFGIDVVPPDEILTIECDVLAPCALGGVIDANLAQKLQCKIVCGGANNILDDPDEDAVALKNQGICYAPDFVVNAGGVVHLAGLHLGYSQPQLEKKNEEIYDTTTQILTDSESPSTYAAAVNLARKRIAEGAQRKQEINSQEQVQHAGYKGL